jgi:hypothetical protein
MTSLKSPRSFFNRKAGVGTKKQLRFCSFAQNEIKLF